MARDLLAKVGLSRDEQVHLVLDKDAERYLRLSTTSQAFIMDDDDMRKEMRKLCYRGNCLVRTFNFCTDDVKSTLFKSYCYSLYCSSLWSCFKRATFQRLKVNYNNIMRRLMQVPPFSSASFLFGSLGVKTVQELIRTNQYSLMRRIESSANSLIVLLNSSEAILRSSIRQHWWNSLFI